MINTFPKNAERRAQSAERKKNNVADFVFPFRIATQEIFRYPKPLTVKNILSVIKRSAPCALLSNFQGGQRQQGKKTSNNPQPDYHLGLGKTPVLKTVVQGSPVKDSPSQPAHPDFILYLRGQCLNQKKASKQWKKQLLLE
jgi:hypothetical protein